METDKEVLFITMLNTFGAAPVQRGDEYYKWWLPVWRWLCSLGYDGLSISIIIQYHRWWDEQSEQTD